MTKTIPRIRFFLAFSAAILVITTRPSSADEPPAAAPAAAAPAAPAAAPAAPRCSRAATNAELTARLADVEAYVTNSQPKAPTLATTSGPGHNAWMMTSAALVLFMTLPGLALFYGGLVRRKNILSVMAQCLGCAGIVTFLWWLVGYSFVFGKGGALARSREHEVRVLEGRRLRAERRLRLLGVAERLLDVPADVRDHHARPDRRRHRRAHEVLAPSWSSSCCGCSSSTSRWPTWCGASTA